MAEIVATTSLPVDRLNGDDCNAAARANINPYGSSGPGRGKSWTNVTFRSKVIGCYGQRKAKIHTLSSPTILS